ncbi:MAG: hypothetical protein ACYS6W_12315, partial [Planctomycetota bacterium]
FRPTDIAVADGNIYISDASRKSVVVYDTMRGYLGEITGRMNTAVSLAHSSDGILYVSSSGTHSIQMFALKNTGATDDNEEMTEPVAGGNSGGSGN